MSKQGDNNTQNNRGNVIRGEILIEGTKITTTQDRPSLASKKPPQPKK